MRGSKASFMNLRMVLFRAGSDVSSFSSEFNSGDCKKSRYFTKLLKCILSEPNHFIISQNSTKCIWSTSLLQGGCASHFGVLRWITFLHSRDNLKLNKNNLFHSTVLYLKESKISSIEFLNQEGFLLRICIFTVNCFKNWCCFLE